MDQKPIKASVAVSAAAESLQRVFAAKDGECDTFRIVTPDKLGIGGSDPFVEALVELLKTRQFG